MKKYAYPLAVLALFTGIFLYLPSYYSQSEALQKATLESRDLFFKIRHLSSPVPEETREVVLVTIDEESCQKLGIRWPWSRKIFAEMVDQLKKHGARVIGLNVSFTGLESEDDAPSEALAQAMREHGLVVIGTTFDSENHLIRSNSKIAEAALKVGYLEKIVDPDYAIRRSYLLRPYLTRKFSSDTDPSFESSFPLQVASAGGSAARFDRELGLLTVGDPKRAVFIGPDGDYTINYLASEDDFKKIPAWKVIQGKLTDNDVERKIVLAGLTSSLFSDTHPTPFGLMPGVAIHANELVSILSGRQLRFLPIQAAFFAAWLAGMVVLILFLLRRFLLACVSAAVIIFALFFGAQFLFNRDLVLDVFILLLGPFLGVVSGITANSLKLLLENRGLETEVIQDKMTGLYTYDFLRVRLDEEWKKCEKSKTPVSIVMMDLDRFKKINDTLGHETGNEMIRRAASVIKESVRGYDVISRYGGDEFVVLLWHANFREAKAYRDRLRNRYHAMAKTLTPELQDFSVSIGIATFDPNNPDGTNPTSPQTLVEEADKDLLSDKENRRKNGGQRAEDR